MASTEGIETAHPSAETGPTLSVVIATHNRVKSLLRTLANLASQTDHPDQIVVVDDCSTDGTSEILADWARKGSMGVKALRLRTNSGPAAARNMGVANALGEVICFTDDDCEPRSDWVQKIRGVFYENPDLAGLGGKVVGSGESSYDAFFDHHRLLDPKFDRDDGSPVYLVTANAAYRKDWILKVGGFDEDIRLPGGEDPALSFKIIQSGGRLAFREEVVVRHHYPSRIAAVSRMSKNYGFGARMVSKAYPPVSARTRKPLLLAYSLVTAAEAAAPGLATYNTENLSPPWLSRLPAELQETEREYLSERIPFARRMQMHALWVVFRLGYYRGWREASATASTMPHVLVNRQISGT